MANVKVEVNNGTKTKKKDNTSTNKQAIQNINRTGTVSGKASGVTGSKNVVTTNTNTSNLAGNNRQQALGTPKTYTANKSNVLAGTPAKRETGKTFISGSANKNYSLEKDSLLNRARKKETTTPQQERTSVQNTYKKSYTEDEYNALRNDLTNAIEDPYYNALWSNIDFKDMWSDEDKAYFENHEKQMQQTANEALAAKGQIGIQKELEETNKGYSITDVVDFDKEGVGNWKDFSTDIKKYDEEIADLDKQISALEQNKNNSLATPEQREQFKIKSDLLKNRRDELNEERKSLTDRQAYQNALIKQNNLEWYKENGTEDEYLQYAAYTGSYTNDLLSDLFLNVTASQVRKVSGVMALVESAKRDLGEANAKKIEETATKLFSTGDITEEERNELVGYAREVLDRNTTDPNESVSAALNDCANQLIQMQENGESATERLVVNVFGNVIDNMIGQYGPAFLFGRAGMMASTAIMSVSGYTSVYQEDIANGFTHEQARNDALFQSGIEFMSELIGGERILRFAEGDIVPRTLAQLGVESLKSGAAETVEEGLGWTLSPLAHSMATGEMPSIEDWNPAELKEACLTAFLAGALQTGAMTDYSLMGTEAPLSGTERLLNSFLTIETQKGKKRVQDFVAELDIMLPDASVRKNIELSDGSRISEREYIGIVKNIAQQQIANYDSKVQVKGVEIIDNNNVNPIQSLAEDSKYTLKETLEPARIKKIQSLMESYNAGQVIQTVDEEMTRAAEEKFVAAESERLAELQTSLDKEGLNIKSALWDQLDDKAKNNATIVANVSEIVGGLPVEFADIRTKDGNIVDGFYDNGRIVVNPNAELGAISTFIHEYTHGIESTQFYQTLNKEVRAIYGSNYNDVVNDLIENYADIKQLSREEAEKEVTANTVQRMLEDTKFIDKLIKYNTNMAYKMYVDLKSMSSYSTIAEQISDNFLRGFDEYRHMLERRNQRAIANVHGKDVGSLGKQFSYVGKVGLKNLEDYIQNNPDSQYKDVYDNLLARAKETADMLQERNEDGTRKYTNDEITEKTGWHLGKEDNNWRLEFYDDGSIDKIYEWSKNEKGKSKNFKDDRTNTKLKDILGEDSLFLKMYPKLANTYVFVSNTTAKIWGSMTPSMNDVNGYMQGDAKRIRIGRYGWDYVPDPKGKYRNKDTGEILAKVSRPLTEDEIRNTIAHEIQHAIQLYEHYYYGDPKKTKYRDLPGEKESFKVGDMQVNKDMRNVDEYGRMITDDQRNDATVSPEPDNGNVETGESEESLDNPVETGELEDSNGEYEEEDTSREDGETDNSIGVETGDLGISEDELPITTVMPSGKLDETPARILEEMPEPKTPADVKRRFMSLADWFLVDRYNGIMDFAEARNNERIKDLVDFAITSSARARTNIYNGMFDAEGKKKIGKSLVEILGDIPKANRNLFDEYMYHYRNIDDMSMKERMGAAFTDKPVFGESVTADDSLQRVMEIEEQHPEFKAKAQDVYDYVSKLLEKQIGGIISQEDYDNYRKMRPHYVPISRNVEKGKGKSSSDPNRLILKFKGGSIDINPMEYALMQYTNRAYETFDKNNLYNEIIKEMGNETEVDTDQMQNVVDNNFDSVRKTDSGHELFAYRNGKKIAVPIDESMYRSIKYASTPDYVNAALKPLADINQARKALITSLNPFFGIRNVAKDIQDAKFNTHYPKEFQKAYLEAVGQIASRGEIYQQYKNLGGDMSNYTARDISDAFKKMQNDKGLSKAFDRAMSLNDDAELAPRLAEFICSLKAGNTVERALYEAAEVTTNFKRGGVGSKFADKYLGFTFLNASIQGYDKHVRETKKNFRNAQKNGARGFLSLMAKLTLASGIPLRLLQDFIWRDDKEYEELSDYIKNNYIIFYKTKNGRFVRINKGRIAAFYQTVLMNGYKTVTKQMNVWDSLIDDATSFFDNIAPNNPLDNNIYAPLVQAANNKTWYGDEIVSDTLQGYNTWEQYDESTDLLSRKIGELSKYVSDKLGTKKFQLSPKKVSYVLDQYTGVLGDMTLPSLTPSTDIGYDGKIFIEPSIASKLESNAKISPDEGFVSSLLNDFTTDPVLKNQKVADFYSLRDELGKNAKGKDAMDEDQLSYKYMSVVSGQMGKLYSEIHDIQGSDLSNKEKMEKTRELRKQINDLARTALDNYDNIDITGNYANVGGVQYYQREDGTWVKPSKSNLEKLDNANLSDEDKGYYYETFGTITSLREDIKSKTPKGQTANYTQATIDAISNSKLSYKGKNALMDSYYDSKFSSHVNGMELTDEQKYNLKVANKLAEGQKDSNGKTISNSKAQATADAYEELGLLDDVLKYIKDNDIAPSEMGLSKTVYNKLVGRVSSGSSNKSSSSKTSSSKAKNRSSSVSAGGITKAKGGGSASKLRMHLAAPAQKKIDSKFIQSYSNVFNRNNSKTSTGSSSAQVCPKCRNRVPSGSTRCPICGTKLN